MIHAELSRSYFEREMRVGRRVIFQWNPTRRFGKDNCPECEVMGNADGDIIEGFIFVDAQRAAVFDLEFIKPSVTGYESVTRFESWADAEDWVQRP